MSVADASLVGNALLVGGEVGGRAAHRIQQPGAWHAPHILPAEVMSVARRQVRSGLLDPRIAAGALDRLARMGVSLHTFEPYRERIWELRDNATPYDAWYLAIAERLGTQMVTADEKLAGVPGIRCDVEVISV